MRGTIERRRRQRAPSARSSSSSSTAAGQLVGSGHPDAAHAAAVPRLPALRRRRAHTGRGLAPRATPTCTRSSSSTTASTPGTRCSSALIDLRGRRRARFAEHFTPRGLIIDFEVDPEDPDARSSRPPTSSCSAPRTRARAGGRSLRGEGVAAAPGPSRTRSTSPTQGRHGAASPTTAATAATTVGRGATASPTSSTPVSGEELLSRSATARSMHTDGRRRRLGGGVPAVRRARLVTCSRRCALVAARQPPPAHSLVRPAGGGRLLPLGRRDLAQHARRSRPSGDRIEFRDDDRRRRHGPGHLHPGRRGRQRLHHPDVLPARRRPARAHRPRRARGHGHRRPRRARRRCSAAPAPTA